MFLLRFESESSAGFSTRCIAGFHPADRTDLPNSAGKFDHDAGKNLRYSPADAGRYAFGLPSTSEAREQQGKLAKNHAARDELKPFWMQSKKDEAKRVASRDCRSRHHPAIGYAENAFALSMILRPKQKGQLNVAN
jgi:hypothetical protein